MRMISILAARCRTGMFPRFLWALVGTLVSGIGCGHSLTGKQAFMQGQQSSSPRLPQDFAVGRLDMAVPVMGRVVFGKTQVSDVQPAWLGLQTGQTAAEWLDARKAQAQSGELSSGRKDALVRSYATASQQPMLIYWKYPQEKTLRMEGYRIVGDQVLVAATDAYANELQSAQTDVEAVLHSFQATPAGEKVQSGFAIDRGVLVRAFDNNEFTNATATLKQDGLPSEVDLQLKVDTHVYSNPAPSTLKERAQRSELLMPLVKADSPAISLHTLQLGPRTVAGVRGLQRITFIEDADKPSLYALNFEFEFGGDANSPTRPYTDITLSGQDLPRVFPRAKLIALWDEMLNSTRFHE